MKGANATHASALGNSPRTLAVDVGGTGIKASVLDAIGRMVVKRLRVATPDPCRPEILMRAITDLTAHLPSFDRISVGFPGVIRGGHVITAPHFDAASWQDYPLESALSRRLGEPARLLNDAEVQGLGVIAGRGLEVVLTLGTGVGTAIFTNGGLAPHLELAHHPIHKRKSYNDYIGNAARATLNAKKWNRRVLRVIEIVDSLLHYDVLHIGGGNATHLRIDLPDDVRIASNDAGITGGIRLWDEDIWQTVRNRDARNRRAVFAGDGPARSSPSARARSTPPREAAERRS
jgi:polyphosphate glucokinase